MCAMLNWRPNVKQTEDHSLPSCLSTSTGGHCANCKAPPPSQPRRGATSPQPGRLHPHLLGRTHEGPTKRPLPASTRQGSPLPRALAQLSPPSPRRASPSGQSASPSVLTTAVCPEPGRRALMPRRPTWPRSKPCDHHTAPLHTPALLCLSCGSKLASAYKPFSSQSTCKNRNTATPHLGDPHRVGPCD